jgi:hypothetical protein
MSESQEMSDRRICKNCNKEIPEGFIQCPNCHPRTCYFVPMKQLPKELFEENKIIDKQQETLKRLKNCEWQGL